MYAPAAGATYTRLFARALMDEARVNERIMVISAAMVGGTGMDAFAQQYPQRFIDVGIAEQHAVTYAGGLAARGERPVVTIYSSFLQRAYDEILHDVCVPRAIAALSGVVKWAHNGSQARYVLWSLFGLALVAAIYLWSV